MRKVGFSLFLKVHVRGTFRTLNCQLFSQQAPHVAWKDRGFTYSSLNLPAHDFAYITGRILQSMYEYVLVLTEFQLSFKVPIEFLPSSKR